MSGADRISDLVGVCCDGGVAEGLIAAREVLDRYEEKQSQLDRITEWSNKMVDQRNEARREVKALKLRVKNLESAWDEQYCSRCDPESETDERCPGCGADRTL